MPDWLAFIAWIVVAVVVFGFAIPWATTALRNRARSGYRSPIDKVLVAYISWAVGLTVVVGMIVYRIAS